MLTREYMPTNNKFTFAEAINEAIHVSMKKDKNMMLKASSPTGVKKMFEMF